MFRKQTRHKFGARKTLCSLNHPHPSALEASVCQILQLREKAGEIRNLKYQATVSLAYGIKWKVDWEFEQRCKVTISGVCTESWWQMFAEAKGAETTDYKLKKRMWKEGCGPAPLEIWKGTARRPMLVETIHPKKEEVK